jgi:hypothetical protein
MGSIVSDVREMAFLGDRRKKGVVFDERGEVPMSKEYCDLRGILNEKETASQNCCSLQEGSFQSVSITPGYARIGVAGVSCSVENSLSVQI